MAKSIKIQISLANIVIVAGIIIGTLAIMRPRDGSYYKKPAAQKEVTDNSGMVGFPFNVGSRRINIRTRGTSQAPWKHIGIVHSESTEDNTVLGLYARESDARRGRYTYQVRNKETGITIPLFEGEEVDELETGDTVNVLGMEGLGTFLVHKDKLETPRYLS